MFLIGTSSGSPDDWIQLRDFLAQQLEQYAADLGGYTIAGYSRASGPDIALGQYGDVASVVDAIRGLSDPGPLSATGDIMAEIRRALGESDIYGKPRVVMPT